MQSRFRACVPALAGALGLFAADAALAGAALRSEEELLYSVALGHSWATQTWDDHGDTEDIGCRNEYTGLSHYVEYGYSYYYTLFGNVGTARSSCGSEGENGLSDLRLGIRGRVNRYLNTRGWEVVLTAPLSGEQVGTSRIGCGAFGLAGNLDRKDKLVDDYLSVAYGLSLRLWESPLAHEMREEVELSGRITSRLGWSAGMQHGFPLSDARPDPQGAASDCGTTAQSVKANAALKYAFTNDKSATCGYGHAVWGEETSVGRSAYCAYTYIWR
jgi:hypothetical protein